MSDDRQTLSCCYRCCREECTNASLDWISVSGTLNETDNADLSTTDNDRHRRTLSGPVVRRAIGGGGSGPRRRGHGGVAPRRNSDSAEPLRRRQSSPFRPPTAVVVRHRIDGARPATCFRRRSITSSRRRSVPEVAPRRRRFRVDGQFLVFCFRRKSCR